MKRMIAVSAFIFGLLTFAVAAGRPDAPQIADRHLAPGGAHLVERQDSGTTVIISTLLDTVTRSAGTTIVTSTVTANPVTITTTTATAGITSSETSVEVSGAVLF
jgi:hypothetical protein